MGLLGDVWDFVSGPIKTIGTTLGEKFLGNKYIGQPAANEAWTQSRTGSAEAWNREYGAYKSRYQNTVADMAKAGINPIMAASSGFNVGSQPKAQAATGYMAHAPSADAAASAKAYKEVDKIEEETQNIAQDTIKKLQEALESVERQGYIRVQKKLASTQEKHTLESINNLKQNHAKMAREMSLIVNKTDLTDVEIQKAEEVFKQLKIVTNRMYMELKQLQTISDVYDTKYAGQAITGLREFLGAIGSLLGPATKVYTMPGGK